MINEIMLQKNFEIIDSLTKWRSMTTETWKSLCNFSPKEINEIGLVLKIKGK